MKSFKSFSQPLSEATLDKSDLFTRDTALKLDGLIKNNTQIKLGKDGSSAAVLKIDDSERWEEFLRAYNDYQSGAIKDKDEVVNIIRDGRSFAKIFNGGKYSIGDITKDVVFGGKPAGGGTGEPKAEEYEQSICVEYNKLKGMDDDSAIKAAGLKVKDYNTMISNSAKLTTVGAKVAKQLSAGKALIHSGSAKGGKNYYKRGSDTTPKSDLYGDTNHRFSLKKHGDGQGAQLMSAKSGEAAGVFEGAAAHFSSVHPDETLKGMKTAMRILNVDLENTAMTKTEVDVGDAKKEFMRWYTEDSRRHGEVAKIVKRAKKEVVIGAGTRNEKKYPPKDKTLLSKLDDIINSHTNAEARVSGAAAMAGNPETYLISVDGSKVLVPDISKYLKAFQKGGAFNRANMRKEAATMVQHSINSGPWQEELTKYLQKNEKLHLWLVYEAGSGHYKFTKEIATSTTAYTGSVSAVANKMLVFGDDGFHDEVDIMKWAESNTNLVSSLDLSFKGSKGSKYMSVRLGAEYSPSLSGAARRVLAEQYEHKDFIDEAYDIFEKELDEIFLEEGWLRNLGQLAGTVLSKVTDAIKNFYNNIIKKFIDLVSEWASNGLNFLMEALGIELEGNVSMSEASF